MLLDAYPDAAKEKIPRAEDPHAWNTYLGMLPKDLAKTDEIKALLEPKD